MNPNSKPPAPPYFIVNGPGHFRVRPDLLEELCFAQAMIESLPRTFTAYRQWLQLCGLSENGHPYDKVQDETDYGYFPEGRVVLHTAVLPGQLHRCHLITDTHRWSARCEGAGLFEFVMLRAVEFASWRGIPKKAAWDYLHAPSEPKPNPGPMRHMAQWSVGFDRLTGVCTILARTHEETESLYLSGKSGYFSPRFAL